IVDRPVPESMPAFKQVFAPLAQRAEDRGVRIAFENCDMRGTWDYGDWNIAHAPTAWELMFNEVPSPALGLEWEPCHQMVSLIDPLPQLRKWIDKVFHVHGKDATVMWDVIRTSGIRGGKQYVHHRTPGFGDTNWNDVITILRLGGYRGSIDIEGWHDPVYRGELEMTGQVRALNYLKECRGGPFVANPR
ncbi:MAG TPA: sugar phosphate isomerase/epimerase, partial [Pirellulales bacterium]|nr:sugar phosphate isomerase/epimerase [Pirellulales bacterium]